jgi:hypothetical protein
VIGTASAHASSASGSCAIDISYNVNGDSEKWECKGPKAEASTAASKKFPELAETFSHDWFNEGITDIRIKVIPLEVQMSGKMGTRRP